MPTINSDISEIAKDILRRFYLKDFEGEPASPGEVKRPRHGAMHVSRTMILTTAVANLYRKYGYPDAVNLTQRQFKIIQIAALMHDSGRKGEGQDLWERESGENCYDYLKELGYTEEEAIWAKDAIVNKNAIGMPGRSFISKCINTADSLDIIRVYGIGSYEKERTDFYRDFLSDTSREFPIRRAIARDFDLLINAAYRLIYMTWDSETENQDITKKSKFERENCLDLIRKKISKDDPNFYILRKLENQLSLDELRSISLKEYKGSGFDRSKKFGQEQFVVSVRNLLAFYRGLPLDTQKIKTELEYLETGINPDRSTTLIGRNTPVFKSMEVGLMIVDPSVDDVWEVGEKNLESGRGSKREHINKIRKLFDPKTLKRVNLKALRKLRKFIHEVKTKESHNEVSMNIRKENVLGIGFYTDRTQNPYNVKLTAIFLQNEYKKHFGINLPIFEYSSKFKEPREYNVTPEKIIRLWVKSFPLMRKKLFGSDVYIGDIKQLIADNPLLENYPPKLKSLIVCVLNNEYKAELNTLLGNSITSDENITEQNLLLIEDILTNSEKIQKIFKPEEIALMTEKIYKNPAMESSGAMGMSLFEKILRSPISRENNETKRKITELFIKYCRNINVFKDNRIIIFAIVGNCNSDLIEILFKIPEVQSCINITPAGRNTPLSIAFAKKSTNIVKLLIDNGALKDNVDINQLNGFLFYKNDIELAKEMAEKSDFHRLLNMQDATGQTPLHIICMLCCNINNDLGFLKKLVEFGADFKIRDSEGRTPIYLIGDSVLREKFQKWYDLQQIRTKKNPSRNQKKLLGRDPML